jgi:hypothetical protein
MEDNMKEFLISKIGGVFPVWALILVIVVVLILLFVLIGLISSKNKKKSAKDDAFDSNTQVSNDQLSNKSVVTKTVTQTTVTESKPVVKNESKPTVVKEQEQTTKPTVKHETVVVKYEEKVEPNETIIVRQNDGTEVVFKKDVNQGRKSDDKIVLSTVSKYAKPEAKPMEKPTAQPATKPVAKPETKAPIIVSEEPEKVTEVKNKYHISRQTDRNNANFGKWKVRKEGSMKTIQYFPTQKEAMDFAKELAKNNNGLIVIHGLNGKIRDIK